MKACEEGLEIEDASVRTKCFRSMKRRGKGRRELGGELQMLGQQSIGCQLIMGCCRHRGRWIVATMTLPTVALALASLVELGPIGSASHCQEHAESLHQLRLQPHSPEQMPLRRRDECLRSHDKQVHCGRWSRELFTL